MHDVQCCWEVERPLTLDEPKETRYFALPVKCKPSDGLVAIEHPIRECPCDAYHAYPEI